MTMSHRQPPALLPLATYMDRDTAALLHQLRDERGLCSMDVVARGVALLHAAEGLEAKP